MSKKMLPVNFGENDFNKSRLEIYILRLLEELKDKNYNTDLFLVKHKKKDCVSSLGRNIEYNSFESISNGNCQPILAHIVENEIKKLSFKERFYLLFWRLYE